MDAVRQQTTTERTRSLVEAVREIEYPLADNADLDTLLDKIGDANYVLLGEASHGTSEYYTWRARLSQRLIQEKGFSFIAVEGDWPDCYRLNRYIKGSSDADSAYDILHNFRRWPTWMWANWEVVALAEWLRSYNQRQGDRAPTQQVGFYGLDVYSLHESMAAITDYLTENEPDALEAAKAAYRCFEPYGENGQAYAWSTTMVPETCEQQVIDLLREIRQQARAPQDDGDPEGAFNAEQNAWVVAEAEHYYRTMLRGSAASWNVRDYHMADTLDRLMDHYGPQAKAIVWEHNTHIGDARATDMARANMVNVGQLVRERHMADGVVLVGFGSHRGTVIAGDAWGEPMQVMQVPRARPESWESVLYQTGTADKLLLLDDLRSIEAGRQVRGHRAIGVVYHPEREGGNYVPSVLPNRYDAFLFIEESQALHPLHLEPSSTRPPELYPWGV
ncbi:MAG: erythromycin esterase family protein [Anaerolineaceae bacterium]|nr:erythromycin esterase family protein [Anaerolineaceae bacterium]